MADTSHLERMGKELKCPICLSLLESAVSLTCNHVFCNACIHKSMRSGSNCPICKVPYQRREIRPAPHMDSLVNIYKSMEVSSGLSLFATQNPSAIKSSDAPKKSADNGYAGAEEIAGEAPESVKGIKSKALSTPKPKKSGRNRGKSSFPTNKRVQVPQSPITETPVQQAITQIEANKLKNNDAKKSSARASEHPSSNDAKKSSATACGHPSSNGKGSPPLSPFFWLREEQDVEKLSQQTDLDHLTGTPGIIPSFSDIKDSDDDAPSKMSPRAQDELLQNCNNADHFDSEMFEWTQRACSPELCSSPIKMQVGETSEFEKMQKEDLATPAKGLVTGRKVMTEHLGNASPLENNSIRDSELQSNSSGSEYGGGKNRSKKTHKRGRNADKRTKNKRQKRNVGQVSKAHDGPETHDGFMQRRGCDSQTAMGSSKADCTRTASYIGSNASEMLNQVHDHVASKLPASLQKREKNSKGIKRCHIKRQVRIKKQKQSLAKSGIIEEPIVSLDGAHGEVDFCEGKLGNGNNDVQLEGAAQAEGKNVNQIPIIHNLGRSFTARKVSLQRDMPALRKCDTTFKCAFCHSTEETEESGVMLHYSEGRPVSEKDGAASVIHSHKNCTEWAPNVYFEDDTAINLEEELARSRRIKCSLCGVKGAALGCYEKSCRKSFHVPCAKTLRECRWDTDHFVMLCPVHASSKLPYELPTLEVKKEKPNLKRKFLRQQSQVHAGHKTNKKLWNSGQSSEKLVLCCSGLATAEKETVSEFAKLSGVVVSKSWNSNVTHVIASVDENEACRRTLKVLMGILEGKWVLSIKWVQACMKATRLVEETPYEISCDIHGIKHGPRLGRLRLLNKQPKLFAGFKFYFIGEFVPSYKGYLQDLVTTAGGTVLHRKPIAETHSTSTSDSSIRSTTIIIYSIEQPEKSDSNKKDIILDHRRFDAETLARSSGSKAVNNSWVLNCIAGHKLLDI